MAFLNPAGARAWSLAALAGLSLAGAARAADPGVALTAVGKEIGDTVGMVQMSLNVVAGEAKGVKVGEDGRIRGKLTMVANGATTGVANHPVYLADRGKVVASAKTDERGAFELAAKPGQFTFFAGKFESAGVARKLNRTDAEAIQTVALEAEAPKTPAPLPAATAGKDSAAPADPFAGKKVYGANDTIKVDGGKFAGIATKLNAEGKRVAIAETGLYLVRNGAVLGKTTTAADGSFSFADVADGPVLLVSSAQPLNLSAKMDTTGMLAQNLTIAAAPTGTASNAPAEFKVDGEDVLVQVQFSDCVGCGSGVIDMGPYSGDLGTTIASTTVGAPCDSCGVVGSSFSSGGFGGGGGCVSGCGGVCGGGGGGFGGRGLGLLGLAGLVAGIVALADDDNGVGGNAATRTRP